MFGSFPRTRACTHLLWHPSEARGRVEIRGPKRAHPKPSNSLERRAECLIDKPEAGAKLQEAFAKYRGAIAAADSELGRSPRGCEAFVVNKKRCAESENAKQPRYLR